MIEMINNGETKKPNTKNARKRLARYQVQGQTKTTQLVVVNQKVAPFRIPSSVKIGSQQAVPFGVTMRPGRQSPSV